MNHHSEYYPEYYRRLFLVAAAWNFLMGFSLLFGEGAMRALTGVGTPFDPLGKQLFASLVLVFGLGYYIVSRDVSRNEGIVLLGIFGKVLVIALFSIHAALGDISFILAAPTIVDLLFALLFAEFLWRGRPELTAAFSANA